METIPRNTHEQVYIHMSIIVWNVKKSFVLESIWIVRCILSLRNNLWCYSTLRALFYTLVSIMVNDFWGFIIVKDLLYFQI